MNSVSNIFTSENVAKVSIIYSKSHHRLISMILYRIWTNQCVFYSIISNKLIYFISYSNSIWRPKWINSISNIIGVNSLSLRSSIYIAPVSVEHLIRVTDISVLSMPAGAQNVSRLDFCVGDICPKDYVDLISNGVY